MIENPSPVYNKNPKSSSLESDALKTILNLTCNVAKSKPYRSKNNITRKSEQTKLELQTPGGRTSFGQSCLLTHELNQTEKSLCAASITREEAARQQEEQSAKEMLATETGSENQNHETRNLGGSGNRWTTEAAPYRRDTRRQNEFLTQREKQDAQNMKTELCSELIATV
jgi:hypothetical protein